MKITEVDLEPLEVLEYISDITVELRDFAVMLDCEILAYFLEMAYSEALRLRDLKSMKVFAQIND